MLTMSRSDGNKSLASTAKAANVTDYAKFQNAGYLGMYNMESCKRETWLHANGIRMEHTSDVVTEGKLVHETSYPNRAARYEEVRIGGSVIDFYDPKEKVIHEIKKSTSKEEAYIWQVKYYLLLFEREGIADVVGMLEYPLLRETMRVELGLFSSI